MGFVDAAGSVKIERTLFEIPMNPTVLNSLLLRPALLGLLWIAFGTYTFVFAPPDPLNLLFFGVTRGDWADFAVQWRSSQFVYVMSLYFCMLSCLFPTLIKDEMVRRGWDNDRVLLAVSVVPLFGPWVYLVVRPSRLESFLSPPNSRGHELGIREYDGE